MPQDLGELKRKLESRRVLASHFGKLVELAAQSLVRAGGSGRPPDFKTQLSAVQNVAAAAMHPREVEAFLRYQIARNQRAWDKYGEFIAGEIARAANLPGVQDAADQGLGLQELQMEALRVYLGHVKHLYFYLVGDKNTTDDERKGRWDNVRHIAGEKQSQGAAAGGQRAEDRSGQGNRRRG